MVILASILSVILQLIRLHFIMRVLHGYNLSIFFIDLPDDFVIFIDKGCPDGFHQQHFDLR